MATHTPYPLTLLPWMLCHAMHLCGMQCVGAICGYPVCSGFGAWWVQWVAYVGTLCAGAQCGYGTNNGCSVVNSMLMLIATVGGVQ